ncbi:MAG: DUF1499 domain-containing protein [Leptospira sp.]|nr:DUF1499 domain-containing protein [Leptospira sp.]
MKLKLIAISSSLTFFFLVSNCTGTRPNDLGIKQGKLKACPSTPNCVSSQTDSKDEEHYLAGVPYKKTTPEAMAILKERILNHPRTSIIIEEKNYIYTEFTTLIMRYVDDVEFYFDENSKILHFRSASRLGKSDLGLNRKRINTLLKDIDI